MSVYLLYDCAHEKRDLDAIFCYFHFFSEYDKTKSKEVKSKI